EFALPNVDGSVTDPLVGDLVMPIGVGGGGAGDDGLEAVDPAQRERRDYGVFKFTLGGRVVYDDNIFLSAREEVADVLYVISPGVSIHLGDAVERARSYLYLNYNPEVVFFQETSEENAVDQNLEVGGAWKGAKLSVAATAGYQNLHGTTADVGGRADRQVFYGNVVLSYGWGGKTSIESGFYFEQSDYGDLSDTRESRNESFVDYQLTEKTSLGLGAAFGKLEAIGVEGGGQNFQQLLFRGRSQIGAKLAVHGRIGADFRQSEVGDDVMPVFGIGVIYEPASGTAVSFNASREVAPSAFEAGEVYTRTAAEMGLEQRIMRRWKVGLEGGVEQLDYEAATEDAEGVREDTGYFVRPSVRYDFREGMRGELFYLLRKSDSNVVEQSYGSNQVGVSLGIDF
ncbi:MAG: outer membrane beta-barrel protein, partial [Verrucomicrobiales bacterium]|nr:outer membrane beta-barrel protein [Verrucomicrobiales bacterium]